MRYINPRFTYLLTYLLTYYNWHPFPWLLLLEDWWWIMQSVLIRSIWCRSRNLLSLPLALQRFFGPCSLIKHCGKSNYNGACITVFKPLTSSCLVEVSMLWILSDFHYLLLIAWPNVPCVVDWCSLTAQNQTAWRTITHRSNRTKPTFKRKSSKF